MDSATDSGTERLAGAAAITAKAVAIGAGLDIVIADCVWDIGDDLDHEHAHRLDLITADKNVRLYFREQDLTSPADGPRAKRTEDRLQRAIAQLLPRAPAATYTFE